MARRPAAGAGGRASVAARSSGDGGAERSHMSIARSMTVVAVNAPPGAATAERAAWIADAAGDATIVYRQGGRLSAVAAFVASVVRRRPTCVYLVDCALATVAAGLAARLTSRATVVLDTGD